MKRELSNAQTAGRLSLSGSSPFAVLGMFIPTASRATRGEHVNGQSKIERAKRVTRQSESSETPITKSGGERTLITEGATALAGMKFWESSKSNPSCVRYAKSPCVRTGLFLTIAMAVGMFGASSATSATLASLPSSGPASLMQHSHTSKVIEVSHKQAGGNIIDDKLEITPKEILNSAVFNWSRVVAMFSLTGSELLWNSGEEEVIDLMAAYMENAEETVRDAFETGLVGDGTANGGRQMVGLGAAIPIIPNTGVYGGIDRATVPNWRTSTFDVTGGDIPPYTTWDSTSALGIISDISLRRSRNGRYPDLWIFDANSWQAVERAFVAHQRIVSDRSQRLGLNGYSYNTGAGVVDLVPAAGIGTVMPEDTAFGIDTRGLAIYTFPGQEFVPFHPGDGMRPINQDAIAQGVVWTGQLVLENPLSQVRLLTNEE